MIDTVHKIAMEMRRLRIPVAATDLISAGEVLLHTELNNRESVRDGLAACLAKWPNHRDVFDVLFDLYFIGSATATAPASLATLDDEHLRELIVFALRHGNRDLLRELAAVAIDRYARIQPGRAVAGTYYIFRTLRELRSDAFVDELIGQDELVAAPGMVGRVGAALRRQRAGEAVTEFERILESEVRRRLVLERGADDVAASLRNPLPEDSDFLTSSGPVVDRMAEIVEPLGRVLARVLLERQYQSSPRKLDIRSTIRASMSAGGVPVTLRYLPPTPPKPRLVVMTDISGSVASFASFALQLTYALRSAFSSVRSFAFVDATDEVSDLIGSIRGITTTTKRINDERRGRWFDGHSDYGNAFETFVERFSDALDNRTTVLVLGDARNNYRDPRVDAFEQISQRSLRVYWLNPERTQTWNDGDAIMRKYQPYCVDAVECRTIRQLAAFVAGLQ